jgi:endonuclease YncB( thermonuclease family)
MFSGRNVVVLASALSGTYMLRPLFIGLILIFPGSSWAADAIVTDGDTITLDGTSFRLDGIDAPEMDQACLDAGGAVWPCGVKARDRLAELIGKRVVKCVDKGPAYPGTRRVGICTVEGQTETLNNLLVREGWALNFEPYGKGRFTAPQKQAEKDRLGIWEGCFAEPHDLRHWNKKTAKLLGPTCPTGDDATVRDILFPDQPNMPPGCSIKGTKSRIYHMEGCGSYRINKTPLRWFCSEEAAQDAGFRKAGNCSRGR